MDADQHFDRPARPAAIALGGGVEALLHLTGATSGDLVTVVEHPMAPGSLIEPHTHEREDEYSYVLRGRLTAQIGDDVIEAGPGELVVKPRGIPHAFWNAGTEPVHFLELISPGGFDEYFFELAAPFNDHDEQAMGEIVGRYRLDLRMETIPELLQRNGLQPPF